MGLRDIWDGAKNAARGAVKTVKSAHSSVVTTISDSLYPEEAIETIGNRVGTQEYHKKVVATGNREHIDAIETFARKEGTLINPAAKAFGDVKPKIAVFPSDLGGIGTGDNYPFVEFRSAGGGAGAMASAVICLPIPPNMNIQDQAQYGETSLDFSEAQLLGSGALKSGQLDAATAGLAGLKGQAADLILGAATKLGGAGTVKAAGIANSLAQNPNIVTEFKQMGTRRWSFAYKFMPRNPDEAQAIRDIQYLFQIRSYPSVKLKYTVLAYPPAWTIKFVNGKLPGIYEKCYLEQVSFTANPSGSTWHIDNTPGETDLQLQFVEAKALTAEDISELQSGASYDADRAWREQQFANSNN